LRARAGAPGPRETRLLKAMKAETGLFTRGGVKLRNWAIGLGAVRAPSSRRARRRSSRPAKNFTPTKLIKRLHGGPGVERAGQEHAPACTARGRGGLSGPSGPVGRTSGSLGRAQPFHARRLPGSERAGQGRAHHRASLASVMIRSKSPEACKTPSASAISSTETRGRARTVEKYRGVDNFHPWIISTPGSAANGSRAADKCYCRLTAMLSRARTASGARARRPGGMRLRARHSGAGGGFQRIGGFAVLL
jgi:hypothetical protein